MPNAIITKDDLKDGCILFLKRWEDVDPRVVQYYGLDKGVYDHPVLILQSNVATGSPLVCLVSKPFMTSLSCVLTKSQRS